MNTPRALAVTGSVIGLTAALAACSTSGSGGAAAGGSHSYKDGTYTASGSYEAPSGTESIDVSITVKDNKVAAVTVTPHATSGNQAQFQHQFASGISSVVVGKNIDSLAVSRVAGSSLTSAGFNRALETIKSDAVEP